MDSWLRKEFLAWLKYDLYLAENHPKTLSFADEFWGIWMPEEFNMNGPNERL